MNLDFADNTPEVEFAYVIRHEFGHALGMIHEQLSPKSGIPWKKEEVYKHYKKYFKWTKERTNRNVLDPFNEGQANASEFDPDSIMMYEIPENGLAIGGRNCELSEQDKLFIAEMYPGVERMSAESISTDQTYIITNVEYRNAAFLEGDLLEKKLKARSEKKNVAAEQVSRMSFAFASSL
jgi:hypothetical protein